MTFTYDLTTDAGKVRFELGDYTALSGVRPGGANFSDEEIEAMLVTEGDVMYTVARLMDVLSREWVLVVDITLGPRKEAFSQVSKQYAKLAAQLRDDSGAGSSGTNLRFYRQDGYRRAYAGRYPTGAGWHRDNQGHGEFS